MKKRLISVVLAAAVGVSLAGCGNSNSGAPVSDEISSTEGSDSGQESDASETKQVADASDMAEVEDVVSEDMVPVYARELVDGSYEISVDSSSSMFKITECTLTVEDGAMSAVMTMSGTGYKYVFVGTGEEAAAADESEYISYEETDDGANTFTIPVEALDQGIACAAFSKKKEMWYDRTLVFRADSLPDEAFVNIDMETVESLGLSDGTYSVEVSLSGGSGRASITTPTELRIEDSQAVAVIEWSSPNYDYMLVDDEKYLPVNDDGNSVFEIRIDGFDHDFKVVADTTAMSTPHEIEYTLYFDSSSLKQE